MSVDLLIDGYNLLHAAGLAKERYAPGDLHRRRARLLQRLGVLLDSLVQQRTTVVFDARRDPPDEPPPQQQRLIRVVFAPAPLEADDLIEQLLSQHSAPKSVVVVSSDRRLRRAARRRGAGSLSSETFLEQLEDDSHRRAATETDNSKSEPSLGDALAERLLTAAGDELRRLENPSPEAEEAADPLDDPAFWENRLEDSEG